MRKALLVLSALLVSAVGAEAALFLDRAAATVNNEVITWGEVFGLMQKELGPKTAGMPHDERRQYLFGLAPRFLERTVEVRLELQEARRLGISATDDDAARAVERIRRENGMDEAQFGEALMREGINMNDYLSLIKDDIMLGKLIDREVRSKVNVTDGDAREYLAQKTSSAPALRLWHIFIPGAAADAEAEARGLYSSISRGGISFSDAARKYSKGPTADSGGDLGEAREDQLVPEFRDALKSAGPDGITEPFAAGGGFNILRAEKADSSGFGPDEMAKARQELQERAFVRELLDWRRRIRENAHIVVMF